MFALISHEISQESSHQDPPPHPSEKLSPSLNLSSKKDLISSLSLKIFLMHSLHNLYRAFLTHKLLSMPDQEEKS